MARLHGRVGGALMTVLVCWTAFASVFTLMLAYSRIPYAAARDGFFFSAFARLHPRGDFPHVSLLVLGAVAMGASFFSLDAVISVFVTSRILVHREQSPVYGSPKYLMMDSKLAQLGCMHDPAAIGLHTKTF